MSSKIEKFAYHLNLHKMIKKQSIVAIALGLLFFCLW